MTIKEWEKEVNQELKEIFGDDISSFWVMRYDKMISLLHERVDDDYGYSYYVELEVYEKPNSKLAPKELEQFIAKLAKDYFYIQKCGCSYDCCGHTFTANYKMTHETIESWASDWIDGKKVDFNLHTFTLMISNGVNY